MIRSAKNKKSVDAIWPTVIIDDVSLKLPKA